MKSQPKYKVCRRLGPGVYEKCQTDTFAMREARKTQGRKSGGNRPRRRKTMSEYSKQLLEKQKVRFTYGVTERQFRGYIDASIKTKNTIQNLYELLELRLDNVIYRLGLAPTRRAARQIVAHGHILVNGKKIKVPSHTVDQKDVITIREGSKDKAVFTLRNEEIEKHKSPSWIIYDMKKHEGKLTGMPTLSEDVGMYDLPTVLEFYSR